MSLRILGASLFLGLSGFSIKSSYAKHSFDQDSVINNYIHLF